VSEAAFQGAESEGGAEVTVLYALKCDEGYIKVDDGPEGCAFRIVGMSKASVFPSIEGLSSAMGRRTPAASDQDLTNLHTVEMTISERRLDNQYD
jgi:hypothetical protein